MNFLRNLADFGRMLADELGRALHTPAVEVTVADGVGPWAHQ